MAEDHEHVARLRDEIPELSDRAQPSEENQHRQDGELAAAHARLTASEAREAALQLRVQHLEEIVVAMHREFRQFRRGPGGPSGDA